MTNAELIAKVKAEIESLKSIEYPCDNSQQATGFCDALDRMTDFLSTIEEQVCPEYCVRSHCIGCSRNDYDIWSNKPIKAKVKATGEVVEGFTDGQGHFDVFTDHNICTRYDVNAVEFDTLESEKPMNPEAAMKELDEKIALVKRRGTWDGVDVDKYMDEVRGREPEKPMGQEKEVKPCHRTREKLAEWSKTQEGRESYEKVAEEMRKQIVPNDLEKAARKSAIAPFNLDVDEEHLYEYPYLPIAEQKFIEGAKWQAEQKPKDEQFPPLEGLDAIKAKYYDDGFKNGFDEGVEEGRRLAEEEQADLFTIVALDAAQRAKEQMMENYPKWRRIKAGERLPCPAYVWTIAYDNYPDCFEGRLMPNIQGVKVGRDTWYLPVDVIHNLPKED